MASPIRGMRFCGRAGSARWSSRKRRKYVTVGSLRAILGAERFERAMSHCRRLPAWSARIGVGILQPLLLLIERTMTHRLCIAPMMDRTDRHFRYLLRLLAP